MKTELLVYGLGKANEVTNAIIKGTDDAKKNLINVPVCAKNTIPHDVLGKYGGGLVLMKPVTWNWSNCRRCNEGCYGECWHKRCIS